MFKVLKKHLRNYEILLANQHAAKTSFFIVMATTKPETKACFLKNALRVNTIDNKFTDRK